MMKKYIINILFPIFILAVLSGCKEDLKMPEIEKTIFPVITFDSSMDQLIEDPADFNGKVVVDLYFKDAPQTATLVIAKNGDYINVKEFQQIKAFPTSVNISGTELENIFGKEIVPGDYFEFGMNSTSGNSKFYAFNPYAESYSSDLMNMPGSSPIAKLKAVCSLNLDDFVGSMTLDDTFWEETYDVTISKISDTQLQVDGMWGGKADFPMIIDVNTQLHTASIKNQVLASSIWGYSNLKYNGSGDINACATSMSFTVAASVDEGGFGNFKLTFTK